jgi:para-nitrobenzyl esterase
MATRTNTIESVTLEIPQGRLVGLGERDVRAFRGIPFAKPPVGRLRWRMPEPAEPWAGVRDATRFGPVCPQAPTPFDSLFGGSLSVQSEDCLYLNVWAPGPERTPHPVIVFIHGGAFVIGAGSQSIYSGAHLARRGVVVVTINYRLGVFGLLDLPDATAGRACGTGAEALADQLLALDWIKRNISAFGGDPGNVTVMGESAGGMSITALLASPLARGLFHRAIIQSGTAHVGLVRERSERLARAVLAALSLGPEDVRRLADIPAAQLVKAQIGVIAAAHGGKGVQRLGRLPFQPALGGPILPVRPIAAIREGAARGIPLLCGTTREEWKLFTAVDPRLRLMSANQFEARLARSAADAALMLAKVYSAGSPFDRFNAYMTDRIFGVPTARLGEAQSRFAPVYAYRFDWRSRLLGGIFGACHALDLGFVFGTYAAGPAAAFFGTGAAADSLACAMMDCWVAFARTGDPSTHASGPWPGYDGDKRATMIFGDGPPRVANAPDGERIDAWNAVPESRLEP